MFDTVTVLYFRHLTWINILCQTNRFPHYKTTHFVNCAKIFKAVSVNANVNLTKVKNKSFLIMTVLSPIIMIALIAIVAYLSQLNNNSERQIAVLDESGTISSIFEDSENVNYTILEHLTLPLIPIR